MTAAPPPVRSLAATKFVAFGDSITEGVTSACLRVTPFMTFAETMLVLPRAANDPWAYPNVLQTRLRGTYPTQSPTVSNRGVGGEELAAGVNRLPAVLSVDLPEILLLQEGANDVNQGRSPASIAASLRSMVREARNRGMQVFLGTLLPQRPLGVLGSCRGFRRRQCGAGQRPDPQHGRERRRADRRPVSGVWQPAGRPDWRQTACIPPKRATRRSPTLSSTPSDSALKSNHRAVPCIALAAITVACGGARARPVTAPTSVPATVPRLTATRFVAFGDSITEGYVQRCPGAETTARGPMAPAFQPLLLQGRAQPSPTGYPAKLQTLLAERYATQTISVINEGAGGEDVQTGAADLARVLTTDAPQVLLLLEGINSLNQQHAEGIPIVVDALRRMIREGRGRG